MFQIAQATRMPLENRIEHKCSASLNRWYGKENMNTGFLQIFPKCHKEISKYLKIFKLYQNSPSYKSEANTPLGFRNGYT